MADKFITPKYLTRALVKQAVDFTWESVTKSFIGDSLLKREECHIVVLVPGMEDDLPDEAKFSPLRPVLSYSESHGDPANWTAQFDRIAMGKALQLWQGRNDDQTDINRHLLFVGDTVYWGGVKYEGIVVACSGVQPHFDKMISGIIAHVIVALADDAYRNDETQKGKDFLC